MITKQMEERFKRSDMGKRGDQTEKMLGIEERHKNEANAQERFT